MKRIREIIRRIEQGATEAVLCRSDEGVLYVAKSSRSGRDALMREWIAGRIGVELGLPIPDFACLYLDAAYAKYSPFKEAAALVSCPGFGSSLISPADDLRDTDIGDVPTELRSRILLFDWWTKNGDRQDGNPNMLWQAHTRSLFVIDHNLAFGDDESTVFWQHHIFRQDRGALALIREQQMPKMEGIMRQVPQFWNEMPEEWTQGSIIQAGEVDTILQRCLFDDFWLNP